MIISLVWGRVSWHGVAVGSMWFSNLSVIYSGNPPLRNTTAENQRGLLLLCVSKPGFTTTWHQPVFSFAWCDHFKWLILKTVWSPFSWWAEALTIMYKLLFGGVTDTAGSCRALFLFLDRPGECAHLWCTSKMISLSLTIYPDWVYIGFWITADVMIVNHRQRYADIHIYIDAYILFDIFSLWSVNSFTSPFQCLEWNVQQQEVSVSNVHRRINTWQRQC